VRFRSDEISTDFFETVGSTLVRGRAFTDADGVSGPKVAIVNEDVAAAVARTGSGGQATQARGRGPGK
jgi:hypothetical protein